MHIGICTGLENIEKVEAMGFDYLEWGVTATAALSDEEFQLAVDKVNKSSIKCEAFNVLFPGNIKLVGPEYDAGVISSYVKKAVSRIAALGAKVVVVGSGGARRVPEGWDREKALDEFVSVLNIIGEELKRYSIIAAIEPLNTSETNIVNSVTEGIEIVSRVNHPNVKLLADFYHMRRENEGMDVVKKAGEYLVHTHIANSNGRVYPLDRSEDDYLSFFNGLRSIGYTGRVSIEASTNDMDLDAPRALSLLRELSNK